MKLRIRIAAILAAAAAALTVAAVPSSAATTAGLQLPAHIESWVQLTRYCHTHSRAFCDVLPAGVRHDYGLGNRPARMIMSAGGDTVFIVADYRGHVRIVDES